jgi:MFS family permease
MSETQVTIRRAPKVPVFLILGGALGAIVTLVLTMLQPADPAVGYPALFGYFLLFGLPAGVALGAVVALVLDWVSRRRARTATAELTVVEGE